MFYVTVMRTSNETRSHADVVVPFDRVESNVARDKRRCKIMVTVSVAIRIASEFLQSDFLTPWLANILAACVVTIGFDWWLT